MRGRPLRFLTTLSVGWIGLRFAVLWPETDATFAVRLPERAAAYVTGRTARAPSPAVAFVAATAAVTQSGGRTAITPPADLRPSDSQILAAVGIPYFIELPSSDSAGTIVAARSTAPISDAPLWSPRRAASGVSRWSLDAWALTRDGPARGSLAPQLGGAQAGVRIGHFLDAARRAAAFVRATTPLRQPGVELAAGVQWQPAGSPVALIAEARRRAGGEVVPVVGMVGGVYRAPVAPRWRLDGYGQAGVVGGRRVEGFADGQVRVVRETGVSQPVKVDIGVGIWGGIQQDVRRFDLGPTVGVALPLRAGGLRLWLDWRQRVAGKAAPLSGPVLTLAAGF